MTVARREIERRRQVDEARGVSLAGLPGRVRAVIEAFHARQAGEEMASEALRGALVDLAACAEALADDRELM